MKPRLSSLPILGKGLQYTVYDLGNGRVLKKPRTYTQRLALTRRWGKYHKLYAGKGAAKQAKIAEYYLARTLKNLRRYGAQIDQGFLGNPVFFEDGSYEQDKVIMLDAYLKTHTLTENKRVLDGFFSAILNQWGYHFCDWTFKFDINYGLNQEGRVILSDIGELHFARSKVADMVRRKLWFKCGSFLRLEGTPLKEYYVQQAEKRLTLGAFEKLWPKKSVPKKKNSRH